MFKLISSQREFVNIIIQVQQFCGDETDRRPRHMENIIRSGLGSISSYPFLCKVERDIEETEGTPRTITLVCPRRKAKELVYWRTFNHIKSITPDLFLYHNPFTGPLTVVMNRHLLVNYVDVAKHCFLDELARLKSHSIYPVEVDVSTTDLNARTCVAHKTMPVIITCCRGGYANQDLISYYLYFFVISLSTAKRLVYYKKNELVKTLKARPPSTFRYTLPAPAFRDSGPRSAVSVALDEVEMAEDLHGAQNLHRIGNGHINTIGVNPIGGGDLCINEYESEPSESSPELPQLSSLSSSSTSSPERGVTPENFCNDTYERIHAHEADIEDSGNERANERSEDDDRSRQADERSEDAENSDHEQADDTLAVRHGRIGRIVPS